MILTTLVYMISIQFLQSGILFFAAFVFWFYLFVDYDY
jgi:hypothetical protein